MTMSPILQSPARPVLPVRALLLAALLLAAAASAQAALFGDEEARKSVAELRASLEKSAKEAQARAEQAKAGEQKLQATIKELQEQLAAAVQRLDAVQREQAGLRNAVERLGREQRQAQAQAAVRSRPVEVSTRAPGPERVVVHGHEFVATPAERRLYQEAMTRIRQREFDAALVALEGLRRDHPQTGYAPLLPLWIAIVQGGQGQHRPSRDGLMAFLRDHPGHALEPEAMLALADSHLGLRDRGAARGTLRHLLARHGGSAAAELARERLATLQ